VVTVDGQSYDVGDHEQIFSIQSVSKPFMFGLALDDHGREEVLSKVGVEPTGEAFNAIVLDEVSNRPFNPLVNAGAIATADLVRGKDFADRIKRTLAMFGRYIGREVYIDNAIFLSERTTGHRNRAISHLMLNFGMVSEQIPDSLELYFQQCSIMVNAHDLAVMGATLANAGVNPVTKERAIERRYVKDVLSIMLTCGMYDYAGEWAYRVGLPAKSGVGGGICAVVPGRAGIGIFSPLLDARGNSVRGIKVCEELSQRFGLHSFELGFDGEQIDEQFQLRRNKG
ncbi:MAG: glutaminase A, partial [Pirellulales bacterium]